MEERHRYSTLCDKKRNGQAFASSKIRDDGPHLRTIAKDQKVDNQGACSPLNNDWGTVTRTSVEVFNDESHIPTIKAYKSPQAEKRKVTNHVNPTQT